MHRLLGALLALVAAASLFSAPASAAQTDASHLIQSVAAKVAEIARTRVGFSREAAMRDVLRHDFDLPYIASAALGAHWNEASEPQKARILAAFETTEARAYSDRLGGFTSVAISSVTSKAPGVWLVDSLLNLRDGNSLKVGWEVRGAGQDLRISDIKVSGVSLFVTQRAAFQSYIQSHGGAIEPLVQVLEARAAR
jgi:ABC-type transporter MlaC component